MNGKFEGTLTEEQKTALVEYRGQLETGIKACEEEDRILAKWQAKWEELEGRLEKLSESIDPLNAKEVGEWMTLKAQINLRDEQENKKGGDPESWKALKNTLRTASDVVSKAFAAFLDSERDALARTLAAAYPDPAAAKQAASRTDYYMAICGQCTMLMSPQIYGGTNPISYGQLAVQAIDNLLAGNAPVGPAPVRQAQSEAA